MSFKLFVVFGLIVLSSKVIAQSSYINPEPRALREERVSKRGIVPSELKGMLPQAQSWDATIAKLGNNPDGWTVTCFASEGDDLYIGGDFLAFDTVSTWFIVHYNRATKTWSTLDGGVTNGVNAIAVHKGKVYVGGFFNSVGSNGLPVGYIAMWDGTQWADLGGGLNGSVRALAFIGDTLYAGGTFTQAGGNDAYYLAYWDGNVWSEAFGGANSFVYSLIATHDSLIVGGDFGYIGSHGSAGQLVRGTALLHDGSWSAYGDGYWSSAIALFEGKLWGAGGYHLPDGTLVNGIATFDGTQWNALGQDTLVGTAGTGDVLSMVPVGDSLFVLGSFSQIAGVPASGIAVYHNGTWSPVAGGLYGYGCAAFPFDGKLYIGGRFTRAGSVSTTAIATLSNNTWSAVAKTISQDVGWETADVSAIAVNDRYVVIGGNFLTIAGQTCNHVAAWDKQTKHWTTLGAGVDGNVFSLAINGNTVIVGGTFNHAGNVTARHIAMCDLTSKVWSPMGDGAHRNIGAIAVKDGKIYAPVFYDYQNQTSSDYLGEWDGSSWTVFGDNGLSSGFIEALAWQGPTLYAAGSFAQTTDNVPVRGIAQLVDGQWGSLNAGLNNYAYALAVSGNTLYVGGEFTEADGLPATSLASWDGSAWNPVGVGFDDAVYALASDGAGGVYAGGRFSQVAGVDRANLVHWNGTSFGTVNGGVSNTVDALAIDGSALYVGGWIETAGSSKIESLHFAELHGAGAGVSSQIFVTNFSVFPNPVSAVSTISFSIEKPEAIHIDLFNSLGERVRSIGGGRYDKGPHEISFEPGDLPNGVYFLRINGEASETTQALVINR